jgi:RNA-splicing ligase RtcB
MDEYAAGMRGVFTTSVSRDTLDESPMAYKPIDEIISLIAPTVDIVECIRPV